MLPKRKYHIIAGELQVLQHLLQHGEFVCQRMCKNEFDIEKICSQQLCPLVDAMESSVTKIVACFEQAEKTATKRSLDLENDGPICKKCKN